MTEFSSQDTGDAVYEESRAIYSGESRISRVLLKAIQSTREMVVITDAPETIGNEQILFVNEAFEEVTQYSREEVIGKAPSLLQGPDTDQEVIEKLVENLKKGERFEGETFNYKKDGTRHRVHWSIDPIRVEDGNITHYVSVQRDVTEQWTQQQKLRELLEERETLLRETHHRVKNNLSTVTGLLELQIMKSDSEKVKEVLTESMNRVQSIAAIHEKLYADEELSTLSIDKYLEDLLSFVESSMGENTETEHIELRHELESIRITPKQAVPLGLIVNELLTNAYKHAFESSSGKGTIFVGCKSEGKQVLLEVKDNGKGLPEDFDAHSSDSLGLSLIDTISQQLEAEYKFYSENGTHFKMKFQKENPE